MDTKGSAVTNPAGGQDVTVAVGKQFGSDKANITAGAFAGANSMGGPPSVGAFVNANANGHGLSLTRTDVPGVSSTISHGAHTNLFKNDHHSVNAQAFSNTVHNNHGPGFKAHGGGLNYNNSSGHGASVGVTNIPGFGRSLDVGARANVFQAPNMSFDVMANSQRHLSGPFQGQSNFGVMGVFSRRF